MEPLIAFLVSVLSLALAGMMGNVLAPLWRRKKGEAGKFECLVIDTSLGLGFISLVLFAAAALQLLDYLWLILALSGIAVTVAFTLKMMPKTREGGSASAASLRLPRLWIFPLVFLALYTLISVLAPPAMSDWDSLAYHLAVPKLYLEHGGFYYIHFTSHSNFPFLMEMLYLPGVALNVPAAAKMMHYWTGVLLIVAIIVLARRHFGVKTAPLAAIAIAGMPIVMWEATTAYVDLATALFTILAVFFLLNYFDGEDTRELVGCALAVGFAASTKMTAVALIPTLLLWLLIDRFSAKRTFEWKRGLLFVGLSLLICAPWYVKSIIYTGNPVYPFFYSIFGGREWTAAMADEYARRQAEFGAGKDAAALLLLPFNITFHSEWFYDTPGLYIGPILLVALPVLIFARYRSRKIMGMLGFFLALIAVWFVLTHQSRYLIPAFVVLAVILSAVLYQNDRLRWTRCSVWVVLLLTALVGVVTMWPRTVRAARYVFGEETRSVYLHKTLDVYPAQHWMNENLPEDAKVALYGDTRGYYLNRDYVWADAWHNVAFTREFASAEELVDSLRSRHITHVMINYRFFPRQGDAGPYAEPVYEAIEQDYLERIYPDDDFSPVRVYRVR